MRRTAAETRELVLETAGKLFYANGIRATGVDRIAAEAGVAPTTLYRLFASKDDLVAAYVERIDAERRKTMDELVAAAGVDPRAQILALVDMWCDDIASGEFHGCPIMATLAEFRDAEVPGHRGAVAVKGGVRARLGELTSRLHVDDPDEVADRLTLVIEGMLASGLALGPDGPAARARALAELVLDSARS